MGAFVKNLIRTLLFSILNGILSHIIGERLSRDKLRWDSFPYQSLPFEKGGRLYKRLGIHRWKDHLPDMSRIAHDMVQKKLGFSRDPDHVLRLIQETCVAELVHVLLIIVSPVLLLFTEGTGSVFLTVFYAATNLPFIMIQRYNRPKLVHLYHRILERETHEKEFAKNESIDLVM